MSIGFIEVCGEDHEQAFRFPIARRTVSGEKTLSVSNSPFWKCLFEEIVE